MYSESRTKKEAGIRHSESKPIQTILCFWTSAHTGLAITQDRHLNKQNLEQVVLKAFEWALESQYYNSETADQAKQQDYYRLPKQKLNASRILHIPEKIMISKTGSFSPKGLFGSSSVFKRAMYIFHCWPWDQSWVPSIGPEAIILNNKSHHIQIIGEWLFWGPILIFYIRTKYSGECF